MTDNPEANRQSYPDIYYFDQGVWTFWKEEAFKREGPIPWVWMGKKVIPIEREWITGKDVHGPLDLSIADWWVKNDKES